MSHPTRIVAIAAAAGSLVLSVGACQSGSDDKSRSDPTQSQAATPTATRTSPTTTVDPDRPFPDVPIDGQVGLGSWWRSARMVW